MSPYSACTHTAGIGTFWIELVEQFPSLCFCEYDAQPSVYLSLEILPGHPVLGTTKQPKDCSPQPGLSYQTHSIHWTHRTCTELVAVLGWPLLDKALQHLAHHDKIDRLFGWSRLACSACGRHVYGAHRRLRSAVQRTRAA